MATVPAVFEVADVEQSRAFRAASLRTSRAAFRSNSLDRSAVDGDSGCVTAAIFLSQRTGAPAGTVFFGSRHAAMVVKARRSPWTSRRALDVRVIEGAPCMC